MLKHSLLYKDVFSVFINANYGSKLLTARHWYIAENIVEFLEIFYEIIVVSGVYYPTNLLILHHLLDIAAHLHESKKKDQNLIVVVYPMKFKFLKYWHGITLLYS